MSTPQQVALNCPLPITEYPQVLLAHGGGGRLMHQLIDRVFLSAFPSEQPGRRHDGAVTQFGGGKLAFTTDSYVVKPLFFPGGNIGSLAVHGTLNDLAMCGARPLLLSAGFILEEGLAMDALWRIVSSMQDAASQAGVRIVTGDTKVVDRGKGDGVYINTAGIGIIEHDCAIVPESVRPGDAILLNGDVGRHGIAVMSEREGLMFETTIESDSADLSGLVAQLLAAGITVHCLRDLTRGGLASALVEIAEAASVRIVLDERSIPVTDGVRGACEILGLDPLYVANEGRMVAFVDPAQADLALSIMRAHPQGANATLIGHVTDEAVPMVTMTSPIGTSRMIDMMSGEQLPRIC